MSFSDETIKGKLSALNETQDSIVSVAQWIMFYRRYADRAAQIWLERLKESNSSKKLNLIYLANEIMQQAKSRKKEDFLNAFMPIIAEAAASAYKGATQEVQLKIRRVVEVWRDRQILDKGIQAATEARMDELDKSKSTKSGSRLGGSLFGASSVPAELQPLAKQHAAISKAETTARPLVARANTEYAENTNPDTPKPSAPVRAGKLGSLLKSLASAESAVNDSIKARKELIEGVEKILEMHRSKLSDEENTKLEVAGRRKEIEAERKEVEDGILRRFTAEETNGLGYDQAPANPNAISAENSSAVDGATNTSPEVEGFTPPPPDVEGLTPNGSPVPEAQPEMLAAGQAEDVLETDTYAADPVQEQEPIRNEPPPSHELPSVLHTESTNGNVGANSTPGFDLLASLNLPAVRPASAVNGESADPRKKRKMSHRSNDMDDQFFANSVGLDDEVAANLGAQ